jgi:hypothetical protein
MNEASSSLVSPHVFGPRTLLLLAAPLDCIPGDCRLDGVIAGRRTNEQEYVLDRSRGIRVEILEPYEMQSPFTLKCGVQPVPRVIGPGTVEAEASIQECRKEGLQVMIVAP